MSNCPVLLQSVLDRYDYTRTLSRSRWAWEFLRRNEEFLTEAMLHGPDEVSVRTACHGITLVRPRTDQMAAERWGLAFFPDPRHDGFTANAFWSSALFPRQVQVQVSPAGPSEACPIYERTVKQCEIVHLVDTAGREHILVKGNGHVVQVQCTGMSMLSPEPVRLGFLIRGTANFASRWRMLDEAQRVYDASPAGTAPWTRTSLTLRNALVAHDCQAAGLSVRETADIIYGKARVDEAWAGPGRSMKDEIRRARARGRDLVSGGYRTLLA
ncbi:DUF2285 domain-containing protein [Hyphomonas sp.]|uniref:DNA -binding domain-containing protein n=1 Tax=Hyphomonas sp. TaxID=87 RepID=UPI000C36A1BD|nr:DUF2285 domain-containing protein [Hyphomonas sp.]MAB11807.1 hypothetical protein [Hyphomonas sp.]MAU66676.1 hypothetical protein [Hyphomonas sp.]MBM57007.1 hypothetical protein [Hyphomonas sp.]